MRSEPESDDGSKLGSLLPLSMSDDGSKSEDPSAPFSEFGGFFEFLFAPVPEGRGFQVAGRLPADDDVPMTEIVVPMRHTNIMRIVNNLTKRISVESSAILSQTSVAYIQPFLFVIFGDNENLFSRYDAFKLFIYNYPFSRICVLLSNRN